MFKACDIKVHYSEVDNDDTIASYAQKNGACVISGDKDYYRYLGGTFKIYSDYEIING
jgi:predicted nuclease of predicted toxin-antitoxin system